ncbi:ion channel [Monashia sp. NPDC004114]
MHGGEAITTITTVGYGDRYPTTLTGRFVAVAMTICGIALVGIVTASLASWLIERLSAEDRKTRSELAEVLDEIRTLKAELAARDRNDDPGART